MINKLRENYSKLLMLLCQKVGKDNELYFIGMGEVLPEPLTRDEELKLLSEMEVDPDSIRKELIERNLRLVVYIARKFDNTGVCLEDLISIGAMGLIKAVNTFDVRKNIKLATYASRCIENEILMHLRKSCKQKLVISLDEPLNTDGEGNELLLCDILGTDGDMVTKEMDAQIDREMLHRALNKLKPRERRIIELRYGFAEGGAQTQKQVADMLGISQSYISRLEKRVLQFLRREIQNMK